MELWDISVITRRKKEIKLIGRPTAEVTLTVGRDVATLRF